MSIDFSEPTIEKVILSTNSDLFSSSFPNGFLGDLGVKSFGFVDPISWSCPQHPWWCYVYDFCDFLPGVILLSYIQGWCKASWAVSLLPFFKSRPIKSLTVDEIVISVSY